MVPLECSPERLQKYTVIGFILLCLTGPFFIVYIPGELEKAKQGDDFKTLVLAGIVGDMTLIVVELFMIVFLYLLLRVGMGV